MFQKTKLLVSRFNPRPPLEVGATIVMESLFALGICFNPRPPLEVGATGRSLSQSATRYVSILAHP